ncbi:MAG: tryptophan 2,3-dioxygenase [Phycisphaerales bacterium]|nr:tryptophan 2,3-dioxygenase [Phycisphaerales bacterium]
MLPCVSVTYGSYLKIPELLSLQKPLSEGRDHDETLFIVIHQVYELWFKQQIHEAQHLQLALIAGDDVTSGATLKRMLTILKTMVGQIDVLETMSPVSFLSFRSLLSNASGFQSWQFREFEFILGNRNPKALERYPEGSAERAALARRLTEGTLWQAFLRRLAKSGHPIPTGIMEASLTALPEPNEEVQKVLLDIYHHHPAERSLCELLVDLDEGIQEWRYRHVKMVERTIGMRMGTGGSPGAQYLRSTLFTPLFTDLWTIRDRI